jgi:hypothetical protein
MFGSKLKIDKNLLERAAKLAEIAGYSSVDEFVTHIIEKEVTELEQAQNDGDVTERLRGLGYIE